MPKASKETMLNWFQDHYEDAAHSVFYTGREGGYQYEAGNRPCIPTDVLQAEFSYADPETINEAGPDLSRGMTPWVRK